MARFSIIKNNQVIGLLHITNDKIAENYQYLLGLKNIKQRTYLKFLRTMEVEYLPSDNEHICIRSYEAGSQECICKNKALFKMLLQCQ